MRPAWEVYALPDIPELHNTHEPANRPTQVPDALLPEPQVHWNPDSAWNFHLRLAWILLKGSSRREVAFGKLLGLGTHNANLIRGDAKREELPEEALAQSN